jgi:hypothetical protein
MSKMLQVTFLTQFFISVCLKERRRRVERPIERKKFMGKHLDSEEQDSVTILFSFSADLSRLTGSLVQVSAFNLFLLLFCHPLCIFLAFNCIS